MAARVTSYLQPNQGVPFTKTWRWFSQDPDTGEYTLPIDLTGWTAKCQIRSGPGPTGYLLEDDVPVTLGSDGSVVLRIPGEMSWAWTWDFGVYDIILTPPVEGVDPVRFAEGRISPDPGVTYGF